MRNGYQTCPGFRGFWRERVWIVETICWIYTAWFKGNGPLATRQEKVSTNGRVQRRRTYQETLKKENVRYRESSVSDGTLRSGEEKWARAKQGSNGERRIFVSPTAYSLFPRQKETVQSRDSTVRSGLYKTPTGSYNWTRFYDSRIGGEHWKRVQKHDNMGCGTDMKSFICKFNFLGDFS